jgi:hypothetical protein
MLNIFLKGEGQISENFDIEGWGDQSFQEWGWKD